MTDPTHPPLDQFAARSLPPLERGRPVPAPLAWRGADLEASGDWFRVVTDDEVAALEAAGRRFVDADPDLRTVQAADHPLEGAEGLLAEIAEAVDVGRGFLTVRGLPVRHYSDALSGAILYLMGIHLGEPQRQNQLGDVLDSVRATTNRSRDDDSYAMASRVRDGLAFHSDASDLVTLLCLRSAAEGGQSLLLSSAELYNEVLRRRPDLVDTLFEPYHFDWYRQDHDAPARTYESPLCAIVDGVFSMTAGFGIIRSAQEYPEVPAFTDAQREALDLCDDIIANTGGLVLAMDLEPGDIQWACNYTVLHSRTPFVDADQYERHRHLLRLWLRRRGRPLPERFGRHVVETRTPRPGPDDAGNFRIGPAVMPRLSWGNERVGVSPLDTPTPTAEPAAAAGGRS